MHNLIFFNDRLSVWLGLKGKATTTKTTMYRVSEARMKQDINKDTMPKRDYVHVSCE